MKKGLFLLLPMLFLAVFLADPTSAEDKIIVKFADSTPKTYSYWPAMQAFEKEVEKKVGDQVDIQLFGGGMLGDQKTLTESCLMNSIQMMVIPTTISQNMVPEHKAFTLPFVWTSWKDVRKYLDSPESKIMYTGWDQHGLKVLAWGHTGYLGIQNSKREVLTPEDLKGLKIRTMQDPLLVDSMNAIGALATPMGLGELYSAVQTGVLDGISTGPQLLYTLKIQEVAKYYSHLKMHITPAQMMINLKFWNKLPDDVKQAMREAAPIWAKINNDYYLDPSRPTSDQQIFNGFREAGVKVSEPDLAPFKEKTKSVMEKYRKSIGPDIVDPLLKAAGYRM